MFSLSRRKMGDSRFGTQCCYLLLLVCLLFFRAEGGSIPITIVESAKARGAGEIYSFEIYFFFLLLLLLCYWYYFFYNGICSCVSAVCLDGSPPAYHIDRGFGSGINNWIVHMEVYILTSNHKL